MRTRLVIDQTRSLRGREDSQITGSVVPPEGWLSPLEPRGICDARG
jgi:hypothetical protein